MDNKKWENVLLEWVNCLKLSKTVYSIEELRNGEFLRNLQKIITKSPNPERDTLSFIFDILKSHYPNYTIENENEIHLADLLLDDLRAIVSLLMHYTCIYDRKEILTSPLCYSLSQSHQLIVRNFLQNISKSTTSEQLSKIIHDCVSTDKFKESPSLHWLSGGSSTNASPLMNILNTPVSRAGRFQEKDRQIAKLESELELEKFEKKELQEQLSTTVDNYKKLEKVLEQKNSEISGLRLEITSLENRTPPHFQDVDSRRTQKRLRSEIEYLEKYIHQLNVEQEQIREEKDAAKDKLKKLEFDCAMWQEKFFTSEKNLEALTEKSKAQEINIENLKIHCEELTSMLNELKRRSVNDSYTEESFQIGSVQSTVKASTPCESLAQSVVEVQLRDVQKELAEVGLKLAWSEERCALLEADKQILTNQKMKLIDEKEALVIQLSDNKETLEQTLEELWACHMELVARGMKIIAQNKDISSLTRERLNSSQRIDATALREQIKFLEEELVKKVEANKQLENTKTDLEQQLKNLQQHFESVSNEMKAASKLFNEVLKFTTDLGKDLSKYKREAKQNMNLKFILEEKIRSLEEEVSMRDLKLTDMCISKNTKIFCLKNEIARLQKIISQYQWLDKEFSKQVVATGKSFHDHRWSALSKMRYLTDLKHKSVNGCNARK